jgi:hypothetical protein
MKIIHKNHPKISLFEIKNIPENNKINDEEANEILNTINSIAHLIYLISQSKKLEHLSKEQFKQAA